MTIDTQKLRQFKTWNDGEVSRLLDHIDAQAAEIARLKRALRVAVLALAHATQEHGKVYEPAYKEVDAALSGDSNAS